MPNAAISSFQFHKGTIKTKVGRIGVIKRPIFQFHKGTIKTAVLKV